MEIIVNGEPRPTPEDQTILGLLREMQLDPREWPWNWTAGS